MNEIAAAIREIQIDYQLGAFRRWAQKTFYTRDGFQSELRSRLDKLSALAGDETDLKERLVNNGLKIVKKLTAKHGLAATDLIEMLLKTSKHNHELEEKIFSECHQEIILNLARSEYQGHSAVSLLDTLLTDTGKKKGWRRTFLIEKGIYPLLGTLAGGGATGPTARLVEILAKHIGDENEHHESFIRHAAATLPMMNFFNAEDICETLLDFAEKHRELRLPVINIIADALPNMAHNEWYKTGEFFTKVIAYTKDWAADDSDFAGKAVNTLLQGVISTATHGYGYAVSSMVDNLRSLAEEDTKGPVAYMEFAVSPVSEDVGRPTVILNAVTGAPYIAHGTFSGDQKEFTRDVVNDKYPIGEPGHEHFEEIYSFIKQAPLIMRAAPAFARVAAAHLRGDKDIKPGVWPAATKGLASG